MIEGAYAQKTVTIKDHHTQESIPYVALYNPENRQGLVADVNGQITFPESAIHSKMQLSSIGYESKMILVKEVIDGSTIYLNPTHLKIDEVVISGTSPSLQKQEVMNVEYLKLKNSALSNSLSETISSVPGVQQVTTGTAIGKPTIRGLSGTRVAVFTHGIRLENQQWGAEHGLGLDATGIEGAEVIKGPASLLYGSDALGGVLYLVDDRFVPSNQTHIEVGNTYNTNTQGIDNYGKIYWSKDRWSINVSGSHRNHKDYKDGDGNIITNTRFHTTDFKSKVGYRSKFWNTTLSYNHLNEKYGINEDGDIGGDRSRSMMAPYQPIKTDILSSENIFYLPSSKIKLTLGYISNERKEIEGEEHHHHDEGDEHHHHDEGEVHEDEEHHEEEEEGEHVGLQMLLRTYSYNAQWIKEFENNNQWIVGSQGVFKRNENHSDEQLIPNTDSRNVGLFTTYNWKLTDHANLLLGGRYDLQNINSTLEDGTQKDRDYAAFSFSAGLNWYLTEKLSIKTNLSSGYRAPNIYELASNGSHPSANRYEIGNEELKKEQALQLDIATEYRGEHFGWYINPFINRIQNYIYLSPTGEKKESLKVYQYKQNDAVLYGGEAGIHYHPHQIHWMHLNSDLSMVYSQDNDGNAIALTPATRILTKLSFDIPTSPKQPLQIFGQYDHSFAQNRVADYETKTPSYGLVNLGISGAYRFSTHFAINYELKANNVLDKTYASHLSRYKDLGINNLGRSVVLGINFPIDL